MDCGNVNKYYNSSSGRLGGVRQLDADLIPKMDIQKYYGLVEILTDLCSI